MAASSEGRSMEKRQAQNGDRFFLFGQVMSSLGESEGLTPPHHTTLEFNNWISFPATNLKNCVKIITFHFILLLCRKSFNIHFYLVIYKKKSGDMEMMKYWRFSFFFSSAFQYCNGRGRKVSFQTSKLGRYFSCGDEVMMRWWWGLTFRWRWVSPWPRQWEISRMWSPPLPSVTQFRGQSR